MFYIRVILFSFMVGLITTVVFYVVMKLKLRKELKVRAEQEVENALSKYYSESREITSIDTTEDGSEM